MDAVFFIIVVIALLSLAVNAILMLYIRQVMGRSSLMTSVTNDILGSLEDFSTHLGNVNDLPLFYGDDTLRALLEHSKSIVEDIENYRDGFDFGEGGRSGRGTTEEATTEED
jgi:hypothetical protein